MVSSIFGGTTGLKYEDLKRERKLVEALLKKGTGKISNWGEGLNAATASIAAALLNKRLDKEQEGIYGEVEAYLAEQEAKKAAAAAAGRGRRAALDSAASDAFGAALGGAAPSAPSMFGSVPFSMGVPEGAPSPAPAPPREIAPPAPDLQFTDAAPVGGNAEIIAALTGGGLPSGAGMFRDDQAYETASLGDDWRQDFVDQVEPEPVQTASMGGMHALQFGAALQQGVVPSMPPDVPVPGNMGQIDPYGAAPNVVGPPGYGQDGSPLSFPPQPPSYGPDGRRNPPTGQPNVQTEAPGSMTIDGFTPRAWDWPVDVAEQSPVGSQSAPQLPAPVGADRPLKPIDEVRQIIAENKSQGNQPFSFGQDLSFGHARGVDPNAPRTSGPRGFDGSMRGGNVNMPQPAPDTRQRSNTPLANASDAQMQELSRVMGRLDPMKRAMVKAELEFRMSRYKPRQPEYKAVSGMGIFDMNNPQSGPVWTPPPDGDSDGTEYGLTPQYGVDANGNPVMIQLGKNGEAISPQMPDGVIFQKEPIRIDAGTSWILLDPITRQPVGQIPKELEAAAAASARGGVLGKAEGESVAGAANVEQQAMDALSLLNDIYTDPALPSITGMFQGRIPPMSQAGTDLNYKINQIKGKAFLAAFESLKGGGQITEREGAAATAAMARLERPQSDTAFRESLQELITIYNRAARRARQNGAGNAPSAPTRRRFNPATGQFEVTQ